MYVFIFVVLGIKPRVMHTVGKRCTTELGPHCLSSQGKLAHYPARMSFYTVIFQNLFHLTKYLGSIFIPAYNRLLHSFLELNSKNTYF